jgi:hypothetical protein
MYKMLQRDGFYMNGLLGQMFSSQAGIRKKIGEEDLDNPLTVSLSASSPNVSLTFIQGEHWGSWLPIFIILDIRYYVFHSPKLGVRVGH